MKKLLFILITTSIAYPNHLLCSSGSATAAGLFGFGLGMFAGVAAAHDHHCCQHCRPLFDSLSEENDLLRGSLHETKKLVRSLKEDNRELVITNQELKEENRELEKEIVQLRRELRKTNKKINRGKVPASGMHFGVAIDARR